MLNGKEKAQILLSKVGKNASSVLEALSQESASFLTASIDDTPQADQEQMILLSKEIQEKIRSESFSSEPLAQHNIEEAGFDTIEFDDDSTEVSQTDVLEDEAIEKPDTKLEESSDQDDNAITEEAKVAPEQTGPNPKKLAFVLTKQKPQIIAYFLSKYDDPLRQNTISFLSEELQLKISSLQVNQIPLENHVFERLNTSILKEVDLLSDHDVADLAPNSSEEEASEKSDDLFNSEDSFDGVISFD